MALGPLNIPYGRQSIDGSVVEAVVRAVQAPWLTTGPVVEEFEQAVAAEVGTKFGVAVSSGTAALHTALKAIGIGPGDEVLVPPITFVATANAVVHCGARPVFVDVDPETLLMDPVAAAAAVTGRTKAILGVDFAGQPCDWAALRAVADHAKVRILDDACHALGARLGGRAVGTWTDASLYSFHPVKHITTGEGGLVATSDPSLAAVSRRFRNHGLDSEFQDRARRDTWIYDVVDFGLNYRLSDLQCALGLSQLRRLPTFLRKRRDLARRYDRALADHPLVRPLAVRKGLDHAYHLYVVRVVPPASRDDTLRGLRAAGIKAALHYPAVHLMKVYRERFGTGPGQAPVAELAANQILSLPIYPDLTLAEQDAVVGVLDRVARAGPTTTPADSKPVPRPGS
ncbi:MAG: DegT/DnrJ/EryC1/StrS family aminotransferase [Thermoplasmatota archaeon]